MKKLFVLGLAMVMAAVVAIPASATPPEIDVWVDEDVWDFENNPCTGSGPMFLEVTGTVQDILFWEGEGGKVVSTKRYEITGPGLWSGHGTITGVQHNGEMKLSWQFVATDGDTGQMLRFHVNIRFPEFGVPNVEPPFGFRCIRP